MEMILTPILTFVGTLIGYFYGSKKSKAETDSIVLQNVKGILEIQSSTIESLREQVEELQTKIEGYESYIQKLQDEISQLRKEMKSKRTTKVQ